MRTKFSLSLCLLFACTPAARVPLASSPQIPPEPASARVVPTRVAPTYEPYAKAPAPLGAPRSTDALEGFVPSAEQRAAWPYETDPSVPAVIPPRNGKITGAIQEDGPDEEEIVACIKPGSCPPTDTGKIWEMGARKFECPSYRVTATARSEVELALSGNLEIETDESKASITVSPNGGALFAASGCGHTGVVACVQVLRTVTAANTSYRNPADRLCFWTTKWGAPPADAETP